MSGRVSNRLMIGLVIAFVVVVSARAEALTRSFEQSGVKVTVSMTPALIDPTKDCEAIVSVVDGADTLGVLPSDWRDRFEGFSLRACYTNEATHSVHFSLLPVPGAQRYRIRAFAVGLRDKSQVGTQPSGWFATQAIALEPARLPEVAAKEIMLSPALGAVQRIGPSWRTIGQYALVAVCSLFVLFVLGLLISKIRLHRKLRRMSPKERALRELSELLKRDLVSRGRVKDFYVELTMVVRRYIERRYGLRAPRQTTEEFLQKARVHSDFSHSSLELLASFLESADLVKFAGVQATGEVIGEATARAYRYLESEPAPQSGSEPSAEREVR